MRPIILSLLTSPAVFFAAALYAAEEPATTNPRQPQAQADAKKDAAPSPSKPKSAREGKNESGENGQQGPNEQQGNNNQQGQDEQNGNNNQQGQNDAQEGRRRSQQKK